MHMGGKDGSLHKNFGFTVEHQEEDGEIVVHNGYCSPVMHNTSHVVHIHSTGRVCQSEFVFNLELNS